jgi:hypothetical protein
MLLYEKLSNLYTFSDIVIMTLKKDEKDWACSTYGIIIICIIIVITPHEKMAVEVIGVDGNIILKWVLEISDYMSGY